jgi:hypothetical protein
MKNISITVNPNAITSLAPPMLQPLAPGQQSYPTPKQVYSVSASIQFDDEVEAIAYSIDLIQFIAKFQIDIAKDK